MPEYTRENTLRIAKRFHNRKRTYLLVNPLQAKHIPVSPTRALAMMNALGDQLAKRYPDTRLVIGFAETATAIGAAVAGRISPDCVYLHTTREDFPAAEQWIEFQEEHSHAVEQKLSGDALERWLPETDTVILVDDEISTGKTLRNMVGELKKRYPMLGEKRIVAASLLNRVSPENEALLEEAGIHSEYLVKLPQEDYTALVEELEIHEAEAVTPHPWSLHQGDTVLPALADPRLGLTAEEWQHSCAALADTFLAQAGEAFPPDSRTLVLGTEECMYPALLLGQALEQLGEGRQVLCHATTRSPIGICGAEGYPIVSGRKLPSFYQKDRTTYLYDLADYDCIVVVSDTPEPGTGAMEALLSAFPANPARKVFYLQGGQHVWYL